ncbi:hypothetical protein D7Y15_18765 [Corallococcus sp. AB030]|nr:hypothetical protein D7Y15_18765 [Corallococcus sp. AB030]
MLDGRVQVAQGQRPPPERGMSRPLGLGASERHLLGQRRHPAAQLRLFRAHIVQPGQAHRAGPGLDALGRFGEVRRPGGVPLGGLVRSARRGQDEHQEGQRPHGVPGPARGRGVRGVFQADSSRCAFRKETDFRIRSFAATRVVRWANSASAASRSRVRTMRWSWLFLSLLLGFTGCAHSGVPTLPASHGHLMSEMEAFQLKKGLPSSGMWDVAIGAEVAPKPPLKLEPEQAPLVFEEAVRTLGGTPGEDAALSAFRDIVAACVAGLAEACRLESEAFTGPKVSSPAAFTYPEALLRPGAFAFMVFHCRIGADGQVRDCKIVEGARLPGVEQNLAACQLARYRPATISGHPVSVDYTFHVRFVPQGITLNRHQELEWARLRVRQNPESRSAWLNLARELAKNNPGDPLYPQAVARAYFLAPRSGWAASEAAWQLVQSGQYAPALGAVRPFVRRSHNPYVLETAAAAQFGLKQCTAALAEQQKAVELLPAEWPAPERERFQRKLQDYQSACAPPKSVSAATDPR